VLLAATCATQPALAQDYPTKPLRMLVGFVTGSGTDAAARLAAQKLDELLKQPVIVDNRTGAGGNVALEVLLKSPADGYTLLMTPASITIQPAMRVKLPYDVPKSFTAVSMVATGPFVLVVHPSVPVKNARDLVAIARAKPGVLNYASSGVGSSAHLQGELLNALAKLKTVHVPYKGSPQAVLATVNGEVDFSFPSITGAQPLLDSGRLRAIGVSTAKRSTLMPNLPTLHESGVPGYDRTGWYGILGPAGVPREIVTRLNAAIAKGTSAPDTRTAFIRQGLEVDVGTPEQFEEIMRREVTQNIELGRNAGIEKQ